MTKEYIEILKRGGIGVVPTDTLYGLVGSALNQKTVERIYKVRKRNSKKPLIVIISSIEDIVLFGITRVTLAKITHIFRKVWPYKTSVILPLTRVTLVKYRYLHRGTGEIAFRVSRNKRLIEILKKTGPLVAPSANTEGNPPAKNISDAKKYFGDRVDFYVSGRVSTKASKIIKYIEKTESFATIRK